MKFFKSTLQPEEREIIDSIRNGAERRKGEERLFIRYSYFIKEAIYKFSLSPEEAFDLYSDSILAAIDKISKESFQERSSLKTWVYSIFHNKYVDFVRKRTTNKNSIHRTLSIPDILLQVSDQAKSVLQELVDKTDSALLKQKMAQLGENCRQMLLFWADGYSDKEIAGALEYKTADVVKTSRLRCLEKLKQLYRAA